MPEGTTTHTIIIYTKENCDRCERFKKNLSLLNLSTQDFHVLERDLQTCVGLHDGWRDDGSVELLSYLHGLQTFQSDNNYMPIVKIDNVIYDGPKAIKYLKQQIAGDL